MFSDPTALAARVALAFDSNGIPYWIGGAVATSIHGELRTTQDPEVALFVASPEDAVLHKLEGTGLAGAFRIGNGATCSAC